MNNNSKAEFSAEAYDDLTDVAGTVDDLLSQLGVVHTHPNPGFEERIRAAFDTEDELGKEGSETISLGTASAAVVDHAGLDMLRGDAGWMADTATELLEAVENLLAALEAVDAESYGYDDEDDEMRGVVTWTPVKGGGES